MNPDLPESATAFAEAAGRAFEDLGGVDCARSAEADPGLRSLSVAPALRALGLDDLDPRADLESACAAAELCRVAGRIALPWPVAASLLHDGHGRPLALDGSDRHRVDHGDVTATWRIAQWPAGGTAPVDAAWDQAARHGLTSRSGSAAGSALRSKLGPFVTPMETGDVLGAVPLRDVALLLSMGSWRVLGVVERAVELTVEHVCSRVQFGQTLSKFQTVQFSLADAAVARDGLRELCRYTLWRVMAPPSTGDSADGAGIADALSLRTYALDVARSVLRTCQQLHGASGLCDEYDISILCRHVQADLRLPWGVERSALEAFDALGRFGMESLFPHGRA